MAHANKIQFKDKVKALKFIGQNGRFGMTAKTFGEFSYDEAVEFYLSHDQKTRNRFLLGSMDPDYASPFDKEKETPKPPANTSKKKKENKTADK